MFCVGIYLYQKQGNTNTERSGSMTKKARLARVQAEHMAEVRKEIEKIDVERLARVLHNSMTQRELEKAIANWNK